MKKYVNFLAVLFFLIFSFSVASLAAGEEKIKIYTMNTDDVYNLYWQDESGTPIVEGMTAFKNNSSLPLLKSYSQSLPSNYSSVALSNVTGVKNQNPHGNCWSFATVACLESDLIKNQGKTTNIDLSESHLTWFALRSRTTDAEDLTYGDGHNFEKPYSDGGNIMYSMYALARGVGPELESEFPQTASTAGYNEAQRYSSAYKVDEVEYLGKLRKTHTNASGQQAYNLQMDADGINILKSEIIEHGAVMGAYYSSQKDACYEKAGVPTSFYNSKINQIYTDHAITLVGWDDNFNSFNPSDMPPQKGAWLCKNSWGTSFGDDGYFWISYCEPTLVDFATYSAVEKNYDYIYQYDGFEHGTVTLSSTSPQFANVFTCKKSAKINSIGFYTDQNGVSCKAEIYVGVTSGNPISGTRVASIDSYAEYHGYHTIQLNTPIQINKNDVYSVVLVYTTSDGSKAKIPIEVTAEASGKAGQSFMYYGGKWVDTVTSSTFNGCNNLCIKAYVEYPCEHKLVYVPQQEATCASNGTKAFYKCEICSNEYLDKNCTIEASSQNKELPKISHSYTVLVSKTDATCEQGGFSVYRCKFCDATKITDKTEKLNHIDEDENFLCDRCNSLMKQPNIELVRKIYNLLKILIRIIYSL